jgi:mannose-6-phosphate isomerase-like protein (cupin superfamily)
MAKITTFVGYKSDTPKPLGSIDPRIVSVQDGIVMKYRDFHGTCVRVVHPANPAAPSKNMALQMVYMPPHVGGRSGPHETERTYLVVEGQGRVTFASLHRKLKKGDFVYVPPGCEYVLETTGNEMFVAIVAIAKPELAADHLAKTDEFTGHETDKPPVILESEQAGHPRVLSVRDGIPVKYPACDGLGIRVVHPVNPAAPANDMGLVIVYLPPHAEIKPGSHETEENYVILAGQGRMTFSNFERTVKKGDIVHLPSWCVHGLRNTASKPCVVLVATAPPNP